LLRALIGNSHDFTLANFSFEIVTTSVLAVLYWKRAEEDIGLMDMPH
jgi:hypothetical protein